MAHFNSADYSHSRLEELMQEPQGRSNPLDRRWYREDLTTQTVPSTHDMDEMLPQALENLLSEVSPSWLRHQQSMVS